jgi:hypothetical protein
MRSRGEVVYRDYERAPRPQRRVPWGVRIVQNVDAIRIVAFPQADDIDAKPFQLADKVIDILRCAAPDLPSRI